MEPSQVCRKRQRVTHACDFCHRRGLKCVPQRNNLDGPLDTADCLTCLEYGQACTRLRQPKKRGKKPRQMPSASRAVDASLASTRPSSPSPSAHTAALPEPSTPPGPPGASHVLAPPHEPCTSRACLSALIDIYLDSIYPLFPFFCETKLLLWWQRAPELHDTYYISVICMCALSARQADKGALFSSDLAGAPLCSSLGSLSSLAAELLQEAVRLTPVDYPPGSEGDVNLLCCYGILALLGIQTGDSALLHRYLGLYHGLSALMGFHNEERWPRSLSRCERETRRRMFWVVYRIEVHNACVLGHPIRTPESQTFVQYPCGVHHPVTLTLLFPDRNGRFEDWFTGWNYTTELYRILEHAIVHFRRKRTVHSTVLWRAEFGVAAAASSTSALILQQLRDLQSNLMPQFAQAALKSSDSGSNRCGFQVANILCTVHLVKMVVLASEKGSFGEVCQTVQDLVGSLGTVPRDYIRAFGTPLMQELCGVGYMLTSITARGHNLSDAEHVRLKSIILFLAAFMETLADCIESATHAACCLRASLARIDAIAWHVEVDSPAVRQTALSEGETYRVVSSGQPDFRCEFGIDGTVDGTVDGIVDGILD